MRPVRLFLSDIDGCLSEPYEPYDLDGFAELRALAARAEADDRLPRLGLCTGRSYGYAEAVAQVLDVRGPVLFESGGGRFDLIGGRIGWSEGMTDDVEAQLDAVRTFFRREVLPMAAPGTVSLDYGKRAQAGVVTLDAEVLARAIEATERFVDEERLDLLVAPTHVSVDVVPRGLTKQAAVEAVARKEGLSLDEVAFIGDTRGDLGALSVVGHPFAPANAQEEVKAAVRDWGGTVTRGAVLDGVLEAYRQCVDHNESVQTREAA